MNPIYDCRFSASFKLSILLAASGLLWMTPAAAGSALDDLSRFDFRHIIRDAKQEVFPTVVFIRVVKETLQGGRTGMHEVSGSGVLISDTGEILSNHHVVDKATEIRCLLHDGRAMNATLVGYDKDLDLALLQLTIPPEGTAPLPYAKLADSGELVEGDFVMAMGAPWGLSRSVSIGIISCARRYLPQRSEYNLWLQTDAAISPGNSGGPLINTDGQIIGINTLGTLIGGDTGFAIPSEVIRQILPELREHGRINWSYTGLELQPLTDFNRNIYFTADRGVMIASTSTDSPARDAGFQAGDRILTIDGVPVTARSEEDLPPVRRRLGLMPKHVPSPITLERDGQTLAINVTPAEKGRVEGDALDCPRWDFTVKAINRFDTPNLYFFQPEGVFIYGVKYPGNAQQAGFQPQDIIIAINGFPVTSLESIQRQHTEAMQTIDETTRAVFTILRSGQRRQLVLDYSRDFHPE